jgi:hypothetical protein
MPPYPLARKLGRPKRRSERCGESLDTTGTRTPTPRPSNPWSVAVLTTLSRLHALLVRNENRICSGVVCAYRNSPHPRIVQAMKEIYVQVQSEGFRRMCSTINRTTILDYLHRLEGFQITTFRTLVLFISSVPVSVRCDMKSKFRNRDKILIVILVMRYIVTFGLLL